MYYRYLTKLAVCSEISDNTSAFNEFNYLLKVDPDLLMKDIIGFKTYEDYKDDWIYEWNKDVPGHENAGLHLEFGRAANPQPDYEWYEAMKDSELKGEALRNKVIMEGIINEDDDESRYKQKRQWNMYTNYDDAYEINLEIMRKKNCVKFMSYRRAIKKGDINDQISLNNDEEYVC
ncbi:hypothetical protein Tco_0788810 [Tanacetum coccineum]